MRRDSRLHICYKYVILKVKFLMIQKLKRDYERTEPKEIHKDVNENLKTNINYI